MPSPIIPIAAAGIQFAGNLLTGNQQEESEKGDRRARLQQLVAQYLMGLQSQGQDRQFAQGQAGLASTQMDPYSQAKDRNAANIRYSFGSGQPFDLSALDPARLNQSADYFYRNVAEVSPNVAVPSVPGGSAEQQRQLRQQQLLRDQEAQTQEILRFLSRNPGTEGRQSIRDVRPGLFGGTGSNSPAVTRPRYQGPWSRG